jgi:hypothetical protein
VFLMRALMPMREHHAWRALALIEKQIADLVRDGVDRDVAERMAWEPPAAADDEGNA